MQIPKGELCYLCLEPLNSSSNGNDNRMVDGKKVYFHTSCEGKRIFKERQKAKEVSRESDQVLLLQEEGVR